MFKSKRLKPVYALVLAAAVAVGATLIVQAPANAEPASTVAVQSSTPQSAATDPATVQAAYEELVASDLPRTSSVVNGQNLTTFSLPKGVQMTFTSPATTGVHPNLSGGFDSRGLYVSFNRDDQNALAAGLGASLAIAICAIPAVGWAACAVAAGIIAIAVTYIQAHGICTGTYRYFRVYPSAQWADGCYKS